MSCTIGSSPQVFETKALDAQTILACQTEFDTLVQQIFSAKIAKEAVAEISTKLTAALNRLGRVTSDDVQKYCMAVKQIARL